jgi:ketosteroid isomerase-like protein
MSQENVEVVRRAFEIVQEGVWGGDHGAAFDRALGEGVIVSNLEWLAAERGGIGLVGVGDGVGRDGYVQFMRKWTEGFEDLAVRLAEIIDVDDDRVIAITGWLGVGKGSHAPVAMDTGMLCTLEAGRIVRSLLFLDPNHAFRAAGLREHSQHSKLATWTAG